jgi:hypothetical protein
MKLISLSIALVLLIALSASIVFYVRTKAPTDRSLSTREVERDVEGDKEVYIPKDLDDCFVELKKILSKETVEKMKSEPEKDMIQYHLGFGMWMRNNWGLWQGSRLSEWFNEKGIYHADDMSGIIFHSFWRHLNDKPLELDQQIKHYEEYWEKMKKNRKA